MNKVTLKIDGMMCGMCEAHINDVIRKNMPDAKKVSSSFKKGESTFLYEGTVDEEKLKEAMEPLRIKEYQGSVLSKSSRFFRPVIRKTVPIGFRKGSGYGWRYTWQGDDPKNERTEERKCRTDHLCTVLETKDRATLLESCHFLQNTD